MKWSEIDRTRREWTIPAERSKNGRKHEVDLCPLAVSILDDLKAEADRKRTSRRRRRSKADPGVAFDEDLVFTTTGTTPVSGHAKAKKALDEAIAALRASSKTLPMAAWRIHDLRRSAATGMARLGFAPHIIEGVLNHLSGARAGIVGTYQLYDLRPERLKALQAWGTHVENLVGRRGGEQVGQPGVHLAER